LNGVPSWNFTPRWSWNVHVFPSFDVVQLFASIGRMSLRPGFRSTSPSKICCATRNDSPSETIAGSR
jgi:hypothetical protein